jgi:hypothetical protein
MTKIMIEDAVNELNTMIMKGEGMMAFERFYHDDVIMQENDAAPTIGKEANRNREIQFYQNVSEFRRAEVLGMAVAGSQSYVTWHFDYTHQQWGLRNYTQVSLQTWKDGKIVKEQFFYGS